MRRSLNVPVDPLALDRMPMQNEPPQKCVYVMMKGCSRLMGGMFPSIKSLWTEVAAQGLAVEVHGTKDAFSDEDAPRFAPLPWTAHARTWPGIAGFSLAQRRAILAAARRPGSLISLHGLWEFPSYIANEIVGERASVVIVHPEGMLEPWALANSAWKKRLANAAWHRRLMRRASCFRALTLAELGQIRAQGISCPVALVPNGIALDTRPAPARSILEQAVPGLGNEPFYLFLSRIHPKKGLPLLVPAWREACLAVPGLREAKLLIAGPDEVGHTQEVRALVSELGLDNQVLVPGPLYGEAKRAALAHAQAFLLPSHSEGFSIAVLEAAAAARPVLMTPGCNFPELEQAGGALIVPPEAKRLASALGDLERLGSDGRSAMGERGRRLVAEQYTWGEVGRRMKSTAEWLLAGSPAPSRPDCVEVAGRG